jgi:hypothetical protein
MSASKKAAPKKSNASKQKGKKPVAPAAKKPLKVQAKPSSPQKAAPAKVDKAAEKTKKAAKPLPAPKPEKKLAPMSAKSVTAAAKEAAKTLQRLTAAKSPKAFVPPTAISSDLLDTVCRETACEALATTAGYCRLHYIKNWRKIKRKEVILKEKKLNIYIEELVSKYPDKYIEAIRLDLASEKEFAKVIIDLDLDESPDEFDPEGEGSENFVESVRSRDFEDSDDTF